MLRKNGNREDLAVNPRRQFIRGYMDKTLRPPDAHDITRPVNQSSQTLLSTVPHSQICPS